MAPQQQGGGKQGKTGRAEPHLLRNLAGLSQLCSPEGKPEEGARVGVGHITTKGQKGTVLVSARGLCHDRMLDKVNPLAGVGTGKSREEAAVWVEQDQVFPRDKGWHVCEMVAASRGGSKESVIRRAVCEGMEYSVSAGGLCRDNLCKEK